jgi:hypothetical protein
LVGGAVSIAVMAGLVKAAHDVRSYMLDKDRYRPPWDSGPPLP